MGRAECFTQACEIAPTSLGVTVVQKELIVTVRRENGATVLNRGPVMLRAGTYLSYVAEHPVGVTTVMDVPPNSARQFHWTAALLCRGDTDTLLPSHSGTSRPYDRQGFGSA